MPALPFFEDLAAAVFARFGFGAFGFFVGPPVFFALDGDRAGSLDEDALLGGTTGTFFGEVDAAAFGAGDFTEAAAAAAPAFFAAALFFAFPSADAGFSVAAAACLPVAVADESLKDPDAPLPFVCTSAPAATADLMYFFMKGDIFSASIL